MASTFTPSPAEQALVHQIFAHADPQKLGALTGEVAVRVFGGAELAPTVLGEIWQIADEANNGWLSHKGVAIAVRLMGYAQKGEVVSTALLAKPGPLPTINGISPVATHSTGASRSKSPQPAGGLPPFTPQDRAKFHTMFLKSGPVNGLLSGEKAQEVFIKSKLPNDTLGHIWSLADTQDRGALDSTDFAIGMYLIQATMTGQLASIPESLPPAFHQQVAGGATGSAVRAHATGGSYSPLASSFAAPATPVRATTTVQQQYTGASQHLLQPQATGPWSSKSPPHLPARPAAASAIGSGAFGSSAPAWDVTPAEKASADRWFDSLDTQKRGFIQDDVAVPFMLESKLSGEDLAQIWDLADMNNDGCLTRDGFAIAWHLIQKKRTGVPIPAALPPSLIPPAMRTAASSPFAAVASPFSAPPPAPEPPKDLFSWDEPVPSPVAAPANAFAVQQQKHISPQHTAQHQQQQQHTGHFAAPPVPARSPFGGAPPAAPAAHHDLLGDDDDVTAAALHDQSAEIGNAQNQVNSTSRSLASAQAERQALETALANQAAQLSALQTQLSAAKAAYETETKLLSGLRERQGTQTQDITRTREELIRAESELSAVRVEKAEVEGAVLRDKEEVRGLQRRMGEVGTEVEGLKGGVERAKKEAKQQKGLLAIARKQLSTKEAERAKVEKELEEARKEAEGVAAEREEVEGALAALEAMPAPAPAVAVPERTLSSDSLAYAAAHGLPATPDVGSPLLAGSPLASSIKSNNPFDRFVGNATPRSQSPFSAPNGFVDPVAPADTSADPFGFARAFEGDGPASPLPDTAVDSAGSAGKDATTPTGELVPQQQTIASLSPTTTDDGGSDVFSTPLTAVGPVFPAIDDVVSSAGDAAPFADTPVNSSAPFVNTDAPPASASAPPANANASTPPTTTHLPGHFEPEEPEHEHETDLGAQLKELEVEESDSDSDSEDEVPLATLAKAKGPDAKDGDAQPRTAGVPEAAANGNENGASTAQAETSFDDVFGVAAPPAAAASPTTAPTDAFGMSSSPFDAPGNTDGDKNNKGNGHAAQPSVAGVNAFDEAIGKIPPGSSPTPQFTSFDSAFDDNFDFGGAPAEAAAFPSTTTPSLFPTTAPGAFPPAPTAATIGAANGHAPSPGGLSDFDSIFTVPAAEQPVLGNGSGSAPTPVPTFPVPTFPTPAAPGAQNGKAPAAASTSFDEAFSGFEATPEAKNVDAVPSPSTTTFKPPSGPPPSDAPAPAPAPQSFPPVSPTSSPKSSSKSSPKASTTAPPPRARSPPPPPASRSATKGRSSTGSKEEKTKDAPTRTSKLSIRLPFGKKKNKAEPLPSAPSQLAPPREETERAVTPAVDDDVEGVKQLTAMGFSRSQAVDALEIHGYDVQKALNSLLGAQ